MGGCDRANQRVAHLHAPEKPGQVVSMDPDWKAICVGDMVFRYCADRWDWLKTHWSLCFSDAQAPLEPREARCREVAVKPAEHARRVELAAQVDLRLVHKCRACRRPPRAGTRRAARRSSRRRGTPTAARGGSQSRGGAPGRSAVTRGGVLGFPGGPGVRATDGEPDDERGALGRPSAAAFSAARISR